MKVLYCDVCKKVIENPIPTRTIYHVADIDICEPCKDELDVAIKSSVWGKKPFDYGWYDEVSLRVLRDGIQRGKISLPRR
jgi:hypothetical protein